MAKHAFTALYVERAKPDADRREIPDPGLSGFYLIVQPSGVKSWAVRYRHAGRPRNAARSFKDVAASRRSSFSCAERWIPDNAFTRLPAAKSLVRLSR